MKSLNAQKMAASRIAQGFHHNDEDLASYFKHHKKRSQKYLRFWGNDYLYLTANKNRESRWLPIPENSEAQRTIRELNRRPQEI